MCLQFQVKRNVRRSVDFFAKKDLGLVNTHDLMTMIGCLKAEMEWKL